MRATGAAKRYVLATAFSAGMSLGLPIILVSLAGLPEELSVACSFVIALVINFFNVRLFVFRSNGPILVEFTAFLATNGLIRLVEYAGFLLLFDLIGLNYIVALASILAFSSIMRFFIFARIFTGSRCG